MLICVTWPWQKRRQPGDEFAKSLHKVEEDCLRRLDYVEAQTERALRFESSWSAATVVDEVDILPAGRKTRVLTAVSSLRVGYWVIIGAVALVSFTLGFGLATCAGGAP
jgi:hypothetical protein